MRVNLHHSQDRNQLNNLTNIGVF